MKKIILALLSTLMVMFAVTGCGFNDGGAEVKDIPTKDIVEDIKGSVELRAMGPIEGDMASELFYINQDDVEEFTIEKGMMNTGLETIAVVKAKEGKVDTIKEAFNKVIEAKKSEAFYPGEAEAVEAAKIEVKGNYVALLIIPEYEEGQNNMDKALEAFNKAFE